MNLIQSFVSNPVKVTVGIILVVLFGVISLWAMPVQLTPEVQIPTLSIETTWPGASPQEVEREIVLEQEEQLQAVEGVRKMSSESMDSMGRITLEFAIGTDMSEALMKVNTRLQQVREYPENANEPVINTSNSSDRPIAWFILTQRPPSSEQLDEFEQTHPQLANRIASIRSTDNPGLAIFRLRELAKSNPEAAGLLPPEVDVTTERRFAEDFIEAAFERVEGVSNANVIGGREEEMQVIIDPQRLAARRLTINDVRNALRAQNQDTSAGDFWEGKRRYVVRTLGQFRNPEQVSSVIIDRRAGTPVYVRDVAEVQLGHKKPDGTVRRFGTSVIAINVMRETGSNILDVNDGLVETTQRLNQGALASRGLFLAQVYDETEYIHSSMGLVRENIVEGGVLTFIVLLLFLRSVRSTGVVFLSISVSIIGMFLLMNLMGRSINVPSLAGIAFAVGMLVDNFIVVLENIYRHRAEGDSILAATINGTKEVWGAVIASTLANLAVFIPVLFVQDEAGQLFRDIALATSSAVALSLLVSLIVVPTFASRLLGEKNDHALDHLPIIRRGWKALAPWIVLLVGILVAWLFDVLDPFSVVVGAVIVALLVSGVLDRFGSAFVATVVGINRWLQGGVLRRVVVAATFVLGTAFLSYLMLPKVEYLPNGNRNLVIGILLPPPGYNLDQIKEVGAEIENRLRPYWDVDPASERTDHLKYPAIADFFYVARGRQLFLGLRAADPLRARELEPLVREAAGGLPGFFAIAKQTSLFESGLTAGRTVEVEIAGADINQLVALGGQIMGRLPAVIPNAQARPVPSLDLSSPEMHIVPKWEQAADMGVSASDLGYTVDALVDGAFASDYYIGGDKIDLTIIGSQQFASRTQDLFALSMATPQGDLVPLSALADVNYRSGPEQINRRERQRAITIEITPPVDVALEDAMQRINEQIIAPMKEQGLFEGIPDPNLSGTADKLRTTWTALRWNLLLALLITYLLMAALFESWLYPFVIILSVPLGAVGGLVGLYMLNTFLLPAGVVQPLDVLTMLGFIILVGTVVNNPILIVEQALVHMRDDGMAEREAVLESVRTRIRPIFMTAFIGLFGLLPLVISPGAGSELYRGLGSVLLGGLVFSTVFTLVLVPTVFSLTLESKEYLVRLWDIAHGSRQVKDVRRETEAAEELLVSGVPADRNPRLATPVGADTEYAGEVSTDTVVVDLEHGLIPSDGNGHTPAGAEELYSSYVAQENASGAEDGFSEESNEVRAR